MTKRWVDQYMFERPWFRALSPRLKCFWLFLICKADLSGVVIVDYDLASFQIGEKVQEEDLSAFEDNVRKLGGVKILLTKFVDFQFGKFDPEQTETRNRVHKAVMDRMRWNGLVGDDKVVKLTGTRWDEKPNDECDRMREAGLEIKTSEWLSLKDYYRGADFVKLAETAITEHKITPIGNIRAWIVERIGKESTKKAMKFDAAKFELPEPFKGNADFVEAWGKWIDSRVKMKKPLTENACAMAMKKFSACGAAIAIQALQDSVMNDWQGVFPERVRRVSKPEQSKEDMLEGKGTETEHGWEGMKNVRIL